MKKSFFSFENSKDWKTTVLSILGAVLMLVGIMWPESLTSETQGAIIANVDYILVGVGAFIPVIVGIFWSKDGDK
jgi:hypothetical protein